MPVLPEGTDDQAALVAARGGRPSGTTQPLPEGDVLYPKLWETPCWFSFRINFLAQRFNEPVYGRIAALHGLLRPEFIILYSLYLRDGQALTDLVTGSAFPKNTLSRASQKLLKKGLIRRVDDRADQRRALLHLTEAGHRIVAGEMGPMLAREQEMLAPLSPAERLTLSDILIKLVMTSREVPTPDLPTAPPQPAETPTA